ncbi:MAG: hypothetical protein KJO21_10970 [Verrucomicrobiae bacterium]|nr:hypothetical protein [Verrucomicrobiae bacterium]NNJ42807.1 hypothetical protein [Akkermansiaceae bacterium]
MKVLPTLEGGLCILPESDADWLELELICADAGRSSHLAESLADLMDSDSEWEQYVMPDLVQSFSSQCRYVAAAIEDARHKNEQGVFIKPSQVENWYGAINLARLSLEARYHLNAIDATDDMKPELRSAHFRDRFYLLLQSMILEYIMDAS